jgi:hypothetical protein
MEDINYVVEELVKILKDFPNNYIALTALSQEFRARNNSKSIKEITHTNIKTLLDGRPEIFKKKDWDTLTLATQLVGTEQLDPIVLRNLGSQPHNKNIKRQAYDIIIQKSDNDIHDLFADDANNYTTIYISHIPPKFDLREEFERFGAIDLVDERRGFAYLTFKKHSAAVAAIQAMDGLIAFHSNLRGNVKLRVKFAPSKYQHLASTTSLDSPDDIYQSPTLPDDIIIHKSVEQSVSIEEFTNVVAFVDGSTIPPTFDVPEMFKRYGRISSVDQKSDIAYINFFNHDDAVSAIEIADGQQVFHPNENRNVTLRVQFAADEYQGQTFVSTKPVDAADISDEVDIPTVYFDISQLTEMQILLMQQCIQCYEQNFT